MADEIAALGGSLGVRMRPAMYIGNTSTFGFIHYLVAPIALSLSSGAQNRNQTD